MHPVLLVRSTMVMSIDPQGCEDVDDAISIQRLDSGNIEVGVHIADVTHFVPFNSLTDLEARKRATTVYLADRSGRREIIYCKRPILCLAPSKILTPHRPASVPPPLVRGEDTLAGWRGGWGVNILEDARHSSVLYICKYFVDQAHEPNR
jgi:hypothetical protein